MKSTTLSQILQWKSLALILSISLTGCGGNNDIQSESPHFAPAPLTSGAGKVESFSGIRNQYQILQTVNGFTVRDIVGNEGSREVIGADAIKFADLSVNLRIGEQAKTISDTGLRNIIELYVAFFNRVPDADGMAYWIKQYKDGTSISNIADSFYQAALSYSSSTGYTANQSNADFVKLIYKNVLGRTGPTEPPAQDVQYWVDQLVKGAATKSSLVISMLYSAHTFEGNAEFGWVPNLLNNKIATAKFFSIDQGINYLTPEESIKKGINIASAVTPTSSNAAKILIGVNDFGFNLSGKNTLVDNLNNVGILTDSKGENHPLRVTLQLDASGNVTSGNYDFQSIGGSMVPCTRNIDNANTCVGMQSSFNQIKQSSTLTLAGANANAVLIAIQDEAGNVFTGTLTGIVWTGSWTKVATANTPSDNGKFSVIANFKSPSNSIMSYNVQDLMLQFYTQHRVWNLTGKTMGVTTPISGSFESIPYANDGGTFMYGNQVLKQMDTSFKVAMGAESLSTIPAIVRHFNYSPITAQIGLVMLDPKGMENFPNSQNSSFYFPTNGKMGDSGKNGSSENRGSYPTDMTITSNTNYGWNLIQENGRDLLCLTTEEVFIPSGSKDKITRCHQVNPDGKLGDYLSISRMSYLQSGTFTTGISLESIVSFIR